ncbi:MULTISPECIES: LysR family transcriptional regulator [unclassified Novosphingobium]|uniref:LysR family transcriptional regulator n=1 Tax=unclassified Novosphingobium TaxID=2644732 RepID=UPI0014461430|nr:MULTISPECIES: LysR family transcriptional regulator [unclassified Novosphingobium]NKJ45020.1 DNA-binding transcriptional LysR family regulator [Novosphingobium sp. SG720]NMN07613.1 DNA-binding transcriptional LysR family regulator [Novosphingobium sp. SG919]NMN89923.1 DNA-binding transcriptional LysR family regulator [Novosphingobium sp. SG916]
MSAPVNLAGVDLNLLLAFEALLKHGSVTHAGAAIGLSQPSMSHALKRLRHLLDDELFCRDGSGMQPTPRAQELAPYIIEGLALLRAAMNQKIEFVPTESDRRFILGMSDVAAFGVLPLLMPALRRLAPKMDLIVVDLAAAEATEELRLGKIDLALNAFVEISAELQSRTLFTIPMTCVVDRRNPRLKDGALSLEAFKELPHVQVAGARSGLVTDYEVQAIGIRRRVALQVPHSLAVPAAVLGTDLIAVLDSLTASAFRDWPDLCFVPPPIPMAPVGALALWHSRNQYDSGHKWLRELIFELQMCTSEEPGWSRHQLQPFPLIR